MAMMLTLGELREGDQIRVGGKAWRLAVLEKDGLRVPLTLCIPADVYRDYVRRTRIDESIHVELHRRPFESMRWEEMWDAALRIRNHFLRTELPPDLQAALAPAIAQAFGQKPVAVRSTAPGEDGSRSSFAGIHESYINVIGLDQILLHIRMVWASLWSDGALLYRRELKLDVEQSAMAVIVQELVAGERSGVAFGQNPADPAQEVIEAVYGLNQGLVDGTVEPDRWFIDPASGHVLRHEGPAVRQRMVPGAAATRLEDLPTGMAQQPPLSDRDIAAVHGAVRRAGELFGRPQDVEWTVRGVGLWLLQSRDITTAAAADGQDRRPWYLSLRRSFENLHILRRRIEEEILPGMDREAAALGAVDPAGLDDAALAVACEWRAVRYEHWKTVYWDDCIPMAHGMRLFGEFYNEAVHPDDPHEFVSLLAGAGLQGVERNRELADIAAALTATPDGLARARREGLDGLPLPLRSRIAAFAQRYAVGHAGMDLMPADVLKLVLALAEGGSPARAPSGDAPALEAVFLAQFAEERLAFARQVLELGRASYRLRDDDNLYLDRVEHVLRDALAEARRRLARRGNAVAGDVAAAEWVRALREPGYTPMPLPAVNPDAATADPAVRPRQLVGQPAGPGVARGPARVVSSRTDLFGIQRGDILVCDTLDPTMTVVLPLAAGIVERRGGMLIHGAIIAREYGLPCVTGIDRAVELIRTGNILTVDGYLGLVRIHEPAMGS